MASWKFHIKPFFLGFLISSFHENAHKQNIFSQKLVCFWLFGRAEVEEELKFYNMGLGVLFCTWLCIFKTYLPPGVICNTIMGLCWETHTIALYLNSQNCQSGSSQSRTFTWFLNYRQLYKSLLHQRTSFFPHPPPEVNSKASFFSSGNKSVLVILTEQHGMLKIIIFLILPNTMVFEKVC